MVQQVISWDITLTPIGSISIQVKVGKKKRAQLGKLYILIDLLIVEGWMRRLGGRSINQPMGDNGKGMSLANTAALAQVTELEPKEISMLTIGMVLLQGHTCVSHIISHIYECKLKSDNAYHVGYMAGS